MIIIRFNKITEAYMNIKNKISDKISDLDYIEFTFLFVFFVCLIIAMFLLYEL